MQNKDFSVERISGKYQMYIIGTGTTVGGPVTWNPDVSCMDDYSNWLTEHYAQWQQIADNTCTARYYTFLCSDPADLDPNFKRIILVRPSANSGCEVIGLKAEQAFRHLFSPTHVPDPITDTAVFMNHVYDIDY